MSLAKKPLLVLKDVCKTYHLDGVSVKAVCHVSFSILSGEMLSIVGPSGSGKSTLMHIIGCLERPSKGQVFLKGRDLTKASDNELADIRNQVIGFIFQSFNLLAKTSALDNVIIPLIYAKISERKRLKLAMEKLTQVGLGDRFYHKPNQLSGGQQQRVAIARALINNPDIILADEPTGNLDTKSGKEIMQILKNLNKLGKTVIIVTHDPDIAKQTKRVIKIIDGKIQ